MTRGSFSDRTLDAVGGCARTLGGAQSDAALNGTEAATLGGLRAHSDRLALRARCHDPRVHHRHRPADPVVAGLYDWLEEARLDALGARWLPGVAANLTAHPGAAHDGVRWLAFEAFSDQPAPREKAPLVAALDRSMPARILDGLRALTAYRRDQERFASDAAAWAAAASAHVPPAPAAPPNPFLRPGRAVRRRLPTRGDPGATRAPLKKRHEETTGNGESSAGTTGAMEIADGFTGYRAYTTAHDRIVNAAMLASREELADLHLKLEADLGGIRSVVARLAKRLLRILLSRQTRHWRFDLDEGVLDGARLAALVASGGHTRPFKAESESPFPSTVVSLLIDHSGSMRGRPMLIAALTVEIFARVLERCGVRCEVLGFTTREWDGGEPAREWAADGYPAHPGRLNALEHIIVKAADVPWRRARVALGLFLRDSMLKENIDGEAVAWAHSRLLSRQETRRMLVVVSDGTPMDEATLAANGHEYLEAHLQKVIADIEVRSPVQLAAIGIGHDVSLFYRNATTIAQIDQLGPALGAKLTALLEARSPGRSRRAARGR